VVGFCSIKGLVIDDTKLSVHWTGVQLPSPPPNLWGCNGFDRYDDGGE